MKISRTVHLASIAASTMGLAGCLVGPDYERPSPTSVPDLWHSSVRAEFEPTSPTIERWWQQFGDETLESLIQRASGGNLDLKQAWARLREARARRGVEAADGWPQVDATGSYEHRLRSMNAPDANFRETEPTDGWSAGLDASWELDLWGRVRRAIESADADIDSALEAYRDVMVSLYAEIAINYLTVRSYQARLAIAQMNVETQERTLELTQSRRDNGIAPELDVTQARSNLESTRSEIPRLEIGLEQSLHRLAVLVGEAPGAVHDLLAEPAALPLPPDHVAVGGPADLLRRRPDIRQAERDLASQTARIGVATAELYPRFTLAGTFEFEAAKLDHLFDWNSRSYSIGPSVRWDIFNAGRIRNNIEVEDARTEQALHNYERTVLHAIEEVENSMVGYVKERARRQSLTTAMENSAQSVELVRLLYTEGVADFQNVLDAERTLFADQDRLAINELDAAIHLVQLYKALGGGWDVGDAEAVASAEAQ